MELGRPTLVIIAAYQPDWADYIGMTSALLVALGFYLLVHCLFISEATVRRAFKETFGRLRLRSSPPGKPIDTAPLAPRLQQLRQNFTAEASSHRPSLKREQLVESKREQLARLAYFQDERAATPDNAADHPAT